ncbi:hypothetical protein ACJX0J_031315, partial [Zea mays]
RYNGPITNKVIGVIFYSLFYDRIIDQLDWHDAHRLVEKTPRETWSQMIIGNSISHLAFKPHGLDHSLLYGFGPRFDPIEIARVENIEILHVMGHMFQGALWGLGFMWLHTETMMVQEQQHKDTSHFLAPARSVFVTAH